jgi:hypothetical protein
VIAETGFLNRLVLHAANTRGFVLGTYFEHDAEKNPSLEAGVIHMLQRGSMAPIFILAPKTLVTVAQGGVDKSNLSPAFPKSVQTVGLV